MQKLSGDEDGEGSLFFSTDLKCLWLTLFKSNIFEKLFQKFHQSVKQFGFRSGPIECQAWSGSILSAEDKRITLKIAFKMHFIHVVLFAENVSQDSYFVPLSRLFVF